MSRWDQRYAVESPPTEPARLLVEFSGLLPESGRVLDVAAGAGRHSVYLAERGLNVLAVDRSREGIARGRELARVHGVAVEWIEANLEQLELPGSRFQVITCFYYRDPALYPKLIQALSPGGVIFYETFTHEQRTFPKGPRNPDHLLAPQELLRAFRGLEVIFYREAWKSRGAAALVARKRDS